MFCNLLQFIKGLIQIKSMKRVDSQNQKKILNFPKGRYYFIKNLSNNQYLTTDNQIQNLSFGKLDNFNLFQVWMIEEITDGTFQIINAYLSLVLEMIQNSVKLTPNKLKNSQTFWVQRSKSDFDSVNENIYVIKEFRNSKKHLFIDEAGVKCKQNFIYRDQCHKWKLLPITNHSLISQTCLIENYHSGLFVQVYQSKQLEGQQIVQNLLNNQFHQRWQMVKKNQYFVFKSLKNGLVIEIKGQKAKEGSNLIQSKSKDTPNQKWILEKHGKRIFIIRSAMDRSLMIGVKSNSIKDKMDLIITKNQGQAFWRIIGNIDI